MTLRGFHETWSHALSAAVAMTLAILTVWGLDDFALDDAWIHLSYVKSLASGDGWSYNPGDHEAGCSSPLWVVLLWLWPTAGAPVPRVLALEVLLHGLTAWCASAWVVAHGRRLATPTQPLPMASIALLAGVLVASLPLSLHAVGSGMEVPLATTLLIAVGWAVWSGRPHWAGLFGMLALWARPELALWTFGLWLGTFVGRRHWPEDLRRAAAWAFAGSLVAGGMWALWLMVTVGAPVPNAFFVKGRGGGWASGWEYLSTQVLPWQPWLVGLGPVVLLAVAVAAEAKRRSILGPMFLAVGVAAVLAVAVTRPLHPEIQFFESRYFVPFLPVPVMVLAFGIAGVHRWLAVALVAPVALVTGLAARQSAERVRAAAADTHLLHTQVARWVAASLPKDATVAVEGAGALRFFTPRSMTIVDLVGLNDHVAARLHFDRHAKICHWVARRPTHAAVPIHWVGLLAEVFEVRPLARFDDPEYTQVEPATPMAVVVVELGAVRPAWRDCPPAGHAAGM